MDREQELRDLESELDSARQELQNLSRHAGSSEQLKERMRELQETRHKLEMLQEKHAEELRAKQQQVERLQQQRDLKEQRALELEEELTSLQAATDDAPAPVPASPARDQIRYGKRISALQAELQELKVNHEAQLVESVNVHKQKQYELELALEKQRSET